MMADGEQYVTITGIYAMVTRPVGTLDMAQLKLFMGLYSFK